MSFVQPWMLWTLPAILLPLIIHLLNRLRYKTVPWAAMMFLLKANKSATRRAKIRQYLLLVSRMLLLLFFLYAMARPLVGGWIGATAGGAPEAVVILLDRSASMESSGPDKNFTKRTHALNLLTQAARQSQGSRFVLVENVLKQPLEIPSAEGLTNLSQAGPTDTAADLPTMFLSAVDYLTKNKVGSAEIWVASDFQSSNWRPNPGEWKDITSRFAAIPNEVRIRILDLSAPVQNNASLSLKNVELRPGKDESARISAALEIKSAGQLSNIPLILNRDGAKSQQDLPITSTTQRHVLRLDVPKLEASGGYGSISLPADEANGDNAAWFVYAPPTTLTTTVISDAAPIAARLKLAAAPDPNRTDRKSVVLAPGLAESIAWKETAFLIWQGGAVSEAVQKLLQTFVETGGVLLVLPSGADASANCFGLSWKAAEFAPAEGPFRVTSWDELDGPLAKTDSGASLAVAKLECAKRQIPMMDDPAVRTFATFADGQPFLIGRKYAKGFIYAAATLPDGGWSNFGEGLVLLPMMQRMLAQGAGRLVPPQMGIAGEWQPSDPQESWVSVDSESPRDWRWQGGVYQNAGKRIALNRPAIEDLPDSIDADKVKELLAGLKVEILADAMETKADRLQSEIWPMMIVMAMLFMCVEMLLATSKGLLPAKIAPIGSGATKAAGS